MKNFLTLSLSAAMILILTACGSLADVSADYSGTLSNSCQTFSGIKGNLLQSAENLSVNDSAGTKTLIQTLDIAKEKLSVENDNLNHSEVPEKFSDSNKKILECLKIEYNLADRLKEILANDNEYEAAENLAKAKDLVTSLKEQSALLNVDGNNFEEVFALSAVYEKIDKYIATKKQLRYEHDTAEQAKKDAAAAQSAARTRPAERQLNTAEYEVGVYPATGLRAFLLTDTISRNPNGFSCTVVCYPSGKPYFITYTFNQGYDGVYFTNSDGYSEKVTLYNTPVEYGVWNYVW